MHQSSLFCTGMMLFRNLNILLLFSPFTSSQILDHLLVATGDPNAESVKTEVIDVGDAGNVCNDLPDYPLTLDGASGGLVQNSGEKYPVVCGGYYYGDYFDMCVTMGKSEFKLLHARAYGSAVLLPDETLWITGGKGGEFGEELSSSEIIKIINNDPVSTEGEFIVTSCHTCPGYPKKLLYYSPKETKTHLSKVE